MHHEPYHIEQNRRIRALEDETLTQRRQIDQLKRQIEELKRLVLQRPKV